MSRFRIFLAVLGLAALAAGHAGAADTVQVRVDTTAGAFVMQLDRARAPLTVANFLAYLESGHYTGLVFHRVVDGFVVQGGGYTPELTLRPVRPPVANESGNGLSNRRGTVAMARTADPHSADAQFYINLADNLDLDPKATRWGYAVFGQVTAGMEVVDSIGQRVTTSRNGLNEVPTEAVVIRSLEVLGDGAPRPAGQ
jgi:cyclophilin family peptidyl-prolyl cis-trans isomerase